MPSKVTKGGSRGEGESLLVGRAFQALRISDCGLRIWRSVQPRAFRWTKYMI
jgi:hypothetical protein